MLLFFNYGGFKTALLFFNYRGFKTALFFLTMGV